MALNRIEIASIPGNTAVNVFINGALVDPKVSLEIFDHSWDGFNVGYRGSGPAQCALGILFHITSNADRSVFWHQQFKENFVAKWQPDNIYEVDVMQWLIDCGGNK